MKSTTCWEPVTWSPEREAAAAESARPAARRESLIAAAREAMAAAPVDPWAPGGAEREPLRHALQAMAHLRPWWHDPALPLDQVYGLPVWDEHGRQAGRRWPPGDETQEEFEAAVCDVIRDMQRGVRVPPILAEEIRPAADRAALGPLRYRLVTRRNPPAVAHDHYYLIRGEHTAMAAWLLGRRTFPGCVWGSWTMVSGPPEGAGLAEALAWDSEFADREAIVLCASLMGLVPLC